MSTIQNANTSVSIAVTPIDVSGTGATERSYSSKKNAAANSAKNGGAHAEGLISRAAQQEARGKTNMAAVPVLRAPAGGIAADIAADKHAAVESALRELRDDPDLEMRLAKIQANPAFIKAMDVPRSGDTGFDIMTIDTKSTDLLIGFLLLMLQSRGAEAKFNGAMTIKNADAVARSADAIRSEGATQLATGVTAGVVGIGMGIGGAAFKAVGAHKNRLNEKHVVAPMKARQDETAKLNNSLNSAKSVKTEDELKTLNVTAADGSNKTLQVAPSDTELSAANHAKIADTINTNQVLDSADALANEANQKTIGKWNLTGDLFTASGGVGGVINSGGQLSVALDRAQQKTSDLDSRVSAQGADDARDKGKSLVALINEMLQSMMAVNQSRNATAGAVAGNIRA